jgi:hypothetical protein
MSRAGCGTLKGSNWIWTVSYDPSEQRSPRRSSLFLEILNAACPI